MKTNYSEIVNVNAIGKVENPVSLNDLMKMAEGEKIITSRENSEKVLFIAVDVQQDFMDNGALGVPGANEDVARITKFIYDNMDKISDIAVSLDTHFLYQIFHPCWWVDKDGNHPSPYTLITLEDLDSGKWKAVKEKEASRNYVKNLEINGKRTLCIWPYHCIQGTPGCALENQFANMICFYSIAKKTVVQRLVKGQDPLSEMYGFIKPEYDTKGYVNHDFLNQLENYDKILIVGEAKSHCVLESIKQILEYYEEKSEVTQKIYILEDCMSSIWGFEEITDEIFLDFKKKYKVNIVKSTDDILS